MKGPRFYLIPAFILLSLFSPRASEGPVFAAEKQRFIFFYSRSCQHCKKIENQLMPPVEEEFGGRVGFEYRDIGEIENYRLLLGLQEKYGFESRQNILPVLFFAGRFLNGNEIKISSLRHLLAEGLRHPQQEPAQGLPAVNLKQRFLGFTPAVIILAGLIDGVNPCAFTVIVFFISFLSLQGYSGRQVLTIGLVFIGTVFFTYIFIGLGLFGFLYRIKGFWLLSRGINIAIGILSVGLGFVSLYDFFKFRKTQDPRDMVLKLPESLKIRIQGIIGSHYRRGRRSGPEEKKGIFGLAVSALACAFAVSIFESVCTGQAYLPTISFILKTSPMNLRALGLLVLYNFMFILPLAAIFIFALLGASSQQFSQFLRRRLPALKLAMAILFFALGVFIIWCA